MYEKIAMLMTTDNQKREDKNYQTAKCVYFLFPLYVLFLIKRAQLKNGQ